MQAALIVIDLQAGFDDPVWGEPSNPACEDNISSLLTAWRATGAPVVFVQHDSLVPGSPLAPALPGHAFKPEMDGPPPDLLVHKSVHSAFHGSPDLDHWLRGHGISDVVISGIQTNQCCETTARIASDLGYSVRFVLDATRTFPLKTAAGTVISGDELMRVTAANLDGEFAEVTSTDVAIRRILAGDIE